MKEVARQVQWRQHADDLMAQYAGFISADSLTAEEKILALVSLVPMALNVVDEARDTIERLNTLIERHEEMTEKREERP